MNSLSKNKGAKFFGPFLFFTVFVFFISTPPVYSAKNKSITYHNLASESAQEKDWANAITQEKRACAHDPVNKTFPKQLAVYYNNYALLIFNKGRYDLAISNFKEAIKLDHGNQTIKDNLYNVTLKEAKKVFKKGRKQEALNLAKYCIDFNSEKSSAYIFLGNIYYQENELSKALVYWKKALNLNPDISNLKETIAKAEKELDVEGDFKRRGRTYFDIRFEGKRDPELVWDIVDALEDARRAIKSDFNFFTDKRITVIIYDTEQFKQTTGKSDWTLGVYNGKIRLRIADVSSANETAKRIIYHEYAHAILHILYPNNIPTWLHEGFAQLSEPQAGSTQKNKHLLRNIIKNGEIFNLEKIDVYFASQDRNKTNLAYLASELFLDYLIDKYGKYKFKIFLEKLDSNIPFEEVVFNIFRLHTKDIETEFVKSLE